MRFRLPLLALIAALGTACGASAEGSSAPQAGDSDVGLDSGGGAHTELPSTQSVTILINNDSGEDRWVVTAGQFCTPFGIQKVGAGSLLLSMGFQCICECANPGPEHVSGYRHLRPGEAFRVTWDARDLTTFAESVDCATRGWASAGVQSVTSGVLRPVKAGAYSVTIGVEKTLPRDCTEPASSGDVSCYRLAGGATYGPPPPPLAGRCGTTHTDESNRTLRVSAAI